MGDNQSLAALIGQKVRVHKNLRRGDWSVTSKGKVVAHVRECRLVDVRFVVSEKRRQAVVARQCREVHAWCEGTLANTRALEGEAIAITYNPYRGGSFTRRDNGAAIAAASAVDFTAADGAKAWL